MTRNGLKREAPGRLPPPAFSSYGSARLIVVRSKVNWSGVGSAAAGACHSGVIRERPYDRQSAGGKGTVNNGFIH
jgi:hypothetical protein